MIQLQHFLSAHIFQVIDILDKHLLTVLASLLLVGVMMEECQYPKMHYFGNPRHAQSMMAYIFLNI